MSRTLSKSEKALVADFRERTGATATIATQTLKKHRYDLNAAINAYFDGGAVGSSTKNENVKKVGDIWEQYKDPENPKLITINGTMQLCEELGIDPEADVVLFCLAADLGSKATGEWEKDPFVKGWLSIDSGIDSVPKMKAALPGLRSKLSSNPEYFKKVYMHTFDLCKQPGGRVMAIDTALSLWPVFVLPNLTQPALSRVSAGESPTGPATSTPAAFQEPEFELWLEFMTKKNKAVSKDTWSLFIDFVRTIDADAKEYDEEAAWPSTIDEFVEFVREKRG